MITFMSPAALANALLHDRGVAEQVTLPVQFLFDGVHAVRLAEASSAAIEVTCLLDGILPASEPALQENLLRWNLVAAVVGPGSLGIDRTGERVVLRLALPTDGLSLETFKAELHALLTRVEHLNGVLVTDPLDYDAAIPAGSAGPEDGPAGGGGFGLISV
jgi:hypothetical protein